MKKWVMKRLFKNRAEVIKYILNGEEWNSVLNALFKCTGVPVGDDPYIEARIKECCTRIANEMKPR